MHHKAREVDGERAEMKASSPRRRTWAEAARIDGEARGESRRLRRRSLRAANESGGEEIAT